MAWYDDQIYVLSRQTLPNPCCNSLSCNSEPPDFLNRSSLIDDTPAKLSEIDREWVAYQTSELKTWRAEKSKAYWLKERVMTNIPDTLLMSDACLLALVKNGNELDDESKIRDFLQPWPGIDKFATDILACLQRSTPNGQTIPSKAERNAALQVARASKKAKFMDDPEVAAAARIQTLQDQWLLKNNKMNWDLKARLKKAQDAEQKQQEKEAKSREKAKSKLKSMISDVWLLLITRLVLSKMCFLILPPYLAAIFQTLLPQCH